MAEVLASLKKIGGNGEKYTETVLWTNPSPNATFPATTVTLSDSLSNYKYIGVKFKNATNNSTECTALISTSDLIKSSSDIYGTSRVGIALQSIYSNSAYVRRVAYISDTSINITLAYQINGTGSQAGVMIPLEILGVNELAHQTVGERYDLLPAREFNNVAPLVCDKRQS